MNDNKVILISIDGMRPDGVVNCGNPFVQEMMKKGAAEASYYARKTLSKVQRKLGFVQVK